MYSCISELFCLYLQIWSFTFSTACFRSPTWMQIPPLGSFSCPTPFEAPSVCTQAQMCVGRVHTLQRNNVLNSTKCNTDDCIPLHLNWKQRHHIKSWTVLQTHNTNLAITLVGRHTILSLPEHNQTSEANEEHHRSNHSFPLWRSLGHLSIALFEADAVHWTLKTQNQDDYNCTI